MFSPGEFRGVAAQWQHQSHQWTWLSSTLSWTLTPGPLDGIKDFHQISTCPDRCLSQVQSIWIQMSYVRLMDDPVTMTSLDLSVSCDSSSHVTSILIFTVIVNWRQLFWFRVELNWGQSCQQLVDTHCYCWHSAVTYINKGNPYKASHGLRKFYLSFSEAEMHDGNYQVRVICAWKTATLEMNAFLCVCVFFCIQTQKNLWLVAVLSFATKI